MKLRLCVLFSWCCLFVMIFGSSDSKSDQLENSSPNQNPNPNEDSKCSFKCEDFKALENDNRELKQKFESLSKQFEEFKNEILSDYGISLLRPPLRGPPGKDGKPGPKGDRGISALPSSCSVAMEILPTTLSKKQRIYPHGNTTKVEVLCDFETDGGGWTIIQKRSRGPKEEFKQNWNEYENGFGSLDGNFWLGLDNIHAFTKNGDQELRIDLEDFQGGKKYAKYSSFSVSDASDSYRLTVAGFSWDSTLQDSFARRHSGQRFSTIDKDNDNWNSTNCAVLFGGTGWWFNSCADSNLNGLYFEKGETVPYGEGIYWYHWKGPIYSLAKSEMKIRKKKP